MEVDADMVDENLAEEAAEGAKKEEAEEAEEAEEERNSDKI